MLAGRGFQALAAFICYRLFTGILYLLVEQQSVSAETFAALAFDTTSVWSYVPLINTINCGKLRLSHKLAVVWVVVSITYLLFVVTMADLMTGYVTGEVTWVSLYPSPLTKLSKANLV
jgi:hypothetical protein